MKREVPDIRIVAGAFLVFSAIMLMGIALPRGDFILVVGLPGSDEAAMMGTISRAGGELVSSGRYQWMAVAHSGSPGFISRLVAEGAFLVLDHALASGCYKGN